MSNTGRRALAGAGIVLLLAVTVAAFLFFDKDSHSASDTLRPLLITMLPLWLVGVLGVRALVRRGQ